ncbi:type II toxin-antitoxin system Phd/YefM family antitoxin [Herbaspirillum sp. NPDC087042]|uniref:type II toxin-antitoxin system Phd/YefM family antitoxin n=1 Tax=Herbaspirillum sp. NPDC087042 TaxID=3364004 RepID=UPI00380DE1E8
MYSLSASQLSGQLDAILELADIDEVILTRDQGESLVLVRESVWRAMQDTIHLLGTDINSDRLLRSLLQVRADLLGQSAR